jgi:hypothetical protein
MNLHDELAARLASLISDQERLLEVIRHEKTELVGLDSSAPAKPSTPPRR